MKIGIFDSGLGGMMVAKAIHKSMLEYDYVYIGDTKRVPYGSRSHLTIFKYTREAIDYLFEKENCGIVIIACNTISACVLKKIQKIYKNRMILGVLIPAAEETKKFNKIGILGTDNTVSSLAFVREIKKINNNAKIFQNKAPKIVQLAEAGEVNMAIPFIEKYLQPLLLKNIEVLVLGCTHYIFYKKLFRKILIEKKLAHIKIISQDEIVPKKLKLYLSRHQEIEKNLSKNKTVKILVTETTPNINKLSKKWFGLKKDPEVIKI